VLIKDPKVVILDEPTAGIDPKGIDQIVSLIQSMAKKKITMIISSHQLPQVQKVCTRVGIMSKGQLVAQGSVDHLGREAVAGGRYRVEVQVTESDSKLLNAIKNIKGVLSVEKLGDSLFISCQSDLRAQISRTIVEAGASLVAIKIEEYGLEEIYRKYLREG
jgi:ABC-2 type transport system ATP-binding protein